VEALAARLLEDHGITVPTQTLQDLLFLAGH
jgi:hypothetical protein